MAWYNMPPPQAAPRFLVVLFPGGESGKELQENLKIPESTKVRPAVLMCVELTWAGVGQEGKTCLLSRSREQGFGLIFVHFWGSMPVDISPAQ